MKKVWFYRNSCSFSMTSGELGEVFLRLQLLLLVSTVALSVAKLCAQILRLLRCAALCVASVFYRHTFLWATLLFACITCSSLTCYFYQAPLLAVLQFCFPSPALSYWAVIRIVLGRAKSLKLTRSVPTLTSMRLSCPFLALLCVWSGRLKCEISISQVLLVKFLFISSLVISESESGRDLGCRDLPFPVLNCCLLPCVGTSWSHWMWFSASGSGEHQALVWGKRLVTRSRWSNWHRCLEAQPHCGPY